MTGRDIVVIVIKWSADVREKHSLLIEDPKGLRIVARGSLIFAKRGSEEAFPCLSCAATASYGLLAAFPSVSYSDLSAVKSDVTNTDKPENVSARSCLKSGD